MNKPPDLTDWLVALDYAKERVAEDPSLFTHARYRYARGDEGYLDGPLCWVAETSHEFDAGLAKRLRHLKWVSPHTGNLLFVFQTSIIRAAGEFLGVRAVGVTLFPEDR